MRSIFVMLSAEMAGDAKRCVPIPIEGRMAGEVYNFDRNVRGRKEYSTENDGRYRIFLCGQPADSAD